MIKKLLATIALISIPALAVAQQWPNIPIVGGGSYCSSTIQGTCANTVPAGPAMTGNETIPADTNLAGGAAAPQTVKIPARLLDGGTLVVSVPLTGDTLTVTAQERQRIVNPAGTIATLTINLPAAAATMYNGQRIGICGTQIVTALTLGAGTGNTFNPTQPTAMLVPVVTGAASCFEFVYSKTSDTAGVWFRTQ
jgi:hypothetical protein